MSDDNKQNKTQKLQPIESKEQSKIEPKPVELPKPNNGETVTKGG